LRPRLGDFVGSPTTSPNKTPVGRVWQTLFHFDRVVAHFALYRLMVASETQLAIARDELGTIPLSGGRRALRALRGAEASVARFVRDLRPFAQDVAALGDSSMLARRGQYDFEPAVPAEHGPTPFFARRMEHLPVIAKRVLAAEAEIRGTVLTISNMLSAAANMRLARSNMVLQVVLAFLALTLAALAIDKIPDWAEGLLAPSSRSAKPVNGGLNGSTHHPAGS
jgi:hypothetical protein